jgi:hypothetical protein
MPGRQLNALSSEESPNLANCTDHNGRRQDQAEAEPEPSNSALKIVFTFRMSFQLFEKGNSVGDASVPP